MPVLRAVLVTVPHLLADIIRHALTGRVGFTIVAEITDLSGANKQLRDLAPDVVIIGHVGTAHAVSAASVRAILPRAIVLVLSADLKQIVGPEENEISEFTIDTLVDLLRR